MSSATMKQQRSTNRNSTIVMIYCIVVLCLVACNSINCQNEEFYTDCNQQRHRNNNNNQQNQRQQRKYLPLGQAAKLQQQRAPDATGRQASEHEEFSLVTSSLASTNQQLANNNHSLQPVSSPPIDGAESSQAALVAAAAESSGTTTPTIAGLDSIGSSVVLQPPVTTTSSIMSTVGKPATATTSLSTPPELSGSNSTTNTQTTPTTSTTTTATSITTTDSTPIIRQHPSREEQPQSGHTRQQAGRRMEDSESTQRSLSQDQDSSTHHQHQHQHENQNQQQPQRSLSQPISSSPSSVSIITPLINPVQQQQHTAHVSASIGQSSESQQSMMRPIYVVGQPITERDYYSSATSGATNNRYPDPEAVAPVSQPASSSEAPAPAVPAANAAPQEADQIRPAETQTNRQQQPKAQEVLGGQHLNKSSRLDDTVAPQVDVTLQSQQDPPTGERMSGPPLVYSGGFLGSALGQQLSSSGSTSASQSAANQSTNQTAASPRLFQQMNSTNGGGASVIPQLPRRPSLPPPVNQANAASGFRSPLSPSGPLLANSQSGQQQQQQQQQQPMLPPMSSLPVNSMSNFYQSSPPYAGNSGLLQPALVGNSFPLAPPQVAPQQQQQQQQQLPPMLAYNKQAYAMANQAREQQQQVIQQQQQQTQQAIQQQQQVIPSPMPGTAPGSGRRPLNITRVEHISAECSNDLIRAVIVFNGTFKGIIYSSGYVNDPTCLYVNGTGSTRYEFNIRLNQCGTLGRQELHQPTIPGEARRRDQVMWNTLSIQYNSIIEQEWDEHFRVSCEYGSDFWKTVSFNPFNVETNTGSPVVFTINPPQCQMDVLLGHGMGPKIAVDGPVTVGDPLTLLIHMKSEKAGYDILVKNCVAHNGGKQRMQLIDSNGCVVNERFISPFRGTYNDNDLRHVTLYAYLKAFRFTGSPVLYLECEIHMCQSACPPQMCYWRRLSKRSVDESDYEYVASNSSSSLSAANNNKDEQPVISDSLSLFKALQVRQEPAGDEERTSGGRNGRSSPRQSKRVRDIFAEDEQAALVCYRHAEVYLFLMTIGALLLLLVSVAVTCCVRLRNLAKSNLFRHGRLLASPSLLSVGGHGDASSIISASTTHLHSPTAASYQQDHHLAKNSSKRAGWSQMDFVARKQRIPHQQPQQYLASFAQFSPKPVYR